MSLRYECILKHDVDTCQAIFAAFGIIQRKPSLMPGCGTLRAPLILRCINSLWTYWRETPMRAANCVMVSMAIGITLTMAARQALRASCAFLARFMG